MLNLLITGYHGHGNSGDEAILLAMKTNIQKFGDDINIIALSFNPEDTKRIYGIDSVQRFNFKEVLFAILKSDVILSGGGTLLQDSTSTRSLIYYLSIILIGKIFGKKVMLYSNGIGPVHHKYNRFLIGLIVNHVDLITLREEQSFEDLKSLKVTKPKTYVTADPVFSLGGKGIGKEAVQKIFENEKIPTNKKIVGISVRAWETSYEYIAGLAKSCDFIYENYGMEILLIPMQFPDDVAISKALISQMKNPAHILTKNYKIEETIGIISATDFIISMRLHTLIFAGVENVPMIGIVYDPKVEYYLNVLGMPSGGDIRTEKISHKKIDALMDEMIKNREKYTEILERRVGQLTEKCNLNEKYLLELISSKK